MQDFNSKEEILHFIKHNLDKREDALKRIEEEKCKIFFYSLRIAFWFRRVCLRLIRIKKIRSFEIIFHIRKKNWIRICT